MCCLDNREGWPLLKMGLGTRSLVKIGSVRSLINFVKLYGLQSFLGVKCSNLTNAARGALGARSLVGKYHPYFDLLARSLANFILILTCSLAHSEK